MTMFCQRTLRIARYGVAMLMICTAAASNAADAVGWYAGLAVGGTQVAAKTASGSSFGPETFGFELSGGRRVSDHFAVDFGLQRLADLAWESGSVDLPQGVDRAKTVFDATALRVNAVGILPFGRAWEASVKGGYAYADLDGQQDYSLNGASSARDVHDTSARFFFGLGIGATVARVWHIRAELQRFYIDPSWLGVDSDTSIDSLMFGAEYRFGQGTAGR